jgi:hypothetical protein
MGSDGHIDRHGAPISPAPRSPGPRAWDDPPIGDLSESRPVVVGVDGSERSVDALSLADVLAGTLARRP